MPEPAWFLSDSGAYANQPASGAPPKMKLLTSSRPPARKTQYESALRRGKATSRAPIMSGTNQLKKAAPRGMIARKIIVSACIVNSWLNCCASTTVPFGTASCARMANASTPPIMKKSMAVTPYRVPMRL